MRFRRLTLPLVVLLTTVGCADSDEGGSAAGATQPDLALASSCAVDHKVMQVAVETYLVNGFGGPVTEQALVDAQLLRAPFDTFDLRADGSTTIVVATPGGTCDGVDLSLAEGGDTQVFDAADGETSCEEQRLVLELALETYLANGGTLPVTETDLLMAGLLRTDFDGYDIDGGLVVPVGNCA